MIASIWTPYKTLANNLLIANTRFVEYRHEVNECNAIYNYKTPLLNSGREII